MEGMKILSDIIIGKNPVLEAIKSGREINKILLAESMRQGQFSQIQYLAKENGIIVSVVPKKKLDELDPGQHQGVIALVAAYKYYEIDDILKKAESKNELPFIIILDEIEDPHNLGSIMRTADAVGAHGIIIPKRRAVGLTSTVAKASTGAIEHIPVARVTNVAMTIEDLKQRGIWVVGADLKKSKDYRELEADFPLALVIGSEGKGISRLVLEKCDFIYRLPMVGHVTSLNASVAGSLLMYEVFRKRNQL
jgi:23S rRNA (guanosine2251-2'-O)-methyltransferase